MDYFSNFASQRRVNQLDQNKRKLMNSYNASLRHQTEATGKMLEMANKQTAAQQVAGQQGSYYFQDWVRQKQLQFGATHPIPQPVQPPITSGQKIQVGMQALQSTPDVFVMGSKLAQSQRDWNKASKLEDKVLSTQAQQTLDQTRNPVRFEGDQFYDAFESPQEIKQVYKEKLLTPENGDSALLLHSDRFKNTLQQRYGENPFQPAKRTDFLGRDKTPPVPQPIAYGSKQGWIYDDKTMAYLNNRNKPEDLSWIPQVRNGVYGNEQARLLQQPQ